MSPRARRVMLVRSEEDSAPTKAALLSHGIEVDVWPLRRVEPGPQITGFRSALGLFPGAILAVTSRRAVPVVRDAWPFPELVASVGPGTTAALEDAGVPVTHRGSGAGAAGLVPTLPRREGDGVVLWPTSDAAGGDLSRLLSERGYQLREFVVYRWAPLEIDEARFRESVTEASAVCFASPSAVRAFATALPSSSKTVTLATLPAVAIGTTTESAIRSVGFRTWVVARRPTPFGLAEATRHLLGDLS